MSFSALRLHLNPAFASSTLPLQRPHRRLALPLTHCLSSRNLAMSASRFPARTAVITGASGGIGAQTAKGLVRDLDTLHRLFLCCRNVPKGDAVAASLRASAAPGRQLDVSVVPVELSSASSIAACADTLREQIGDDPLDLLICNAGIMAPPLGFAEQPGHVGGELGRIEQQFVVNHLSHALLTQRLLPLLRREDGGRVVFVSSLAAAMARGRTTAPLIAERTADALNERNYERWKMYAESKLAMSMYARALARKEEKVESVSLHPGVVQTELVRYLVPGRVARWMDAGDEPGWVQKGLAFFGLKTPEQGAELSLELAERPRGDLGDGEFFVATGGKKITERAAPLLRNDAECERVFEDAQKFVDAF